MSKKTILLFLYFLVHLCLPINAFAEENYRVSGTGYNYVEPGFRASMGLNITSSSLENSWLRYYYAQVQLNLISTSITELTVEGDTATITGKGTVQGVASYTFTATVTDGSPDAMGLEILNPDGSLYYIVEPKNVIRGNFIISAQ